MSRYCLRSIPALPTSAMASPSDSITEASRKLPLSFTRLAAFGVSETTKSFSRSHRRAGPQLRHRGGRIQEPPRNAVPLSRGRLEPLRQGDTDGARGDVDRGCEQ